MVEYPREVTDVQWAKIETLFYPLLPRLKGAVHA